MSKILEPNYQILYKSTIYALRDTFNRYRDAINESLKWTFIDSDGEFCVLAGYEDRQAEIEELKKEMLRLQFKIKELKEFVG